MRLPRVTVCGLRPWSLVHLYARRLNGRYAQELLAVAGIAVGAALVMGVLTANTSITSSADQLMRSLTGTARVQLSARSASGFDQATAERAGSLPSVRAAAPVLREQALILTPHGHAQIELLGISPSMLALKGAVTRNLGSGALLLGGGIGLPTSVGETLDARPGEKVRVLVGGLAHTTTVRAILGSQTIGPVANSPVAVTLLPIAQQLAGMPGRITEVLIAPAPGQLARAEAELSTLAKGRLAVEPADHELRVLNQASGPNGESTELFAVLAAMVGALLALNAALLSAGERRAFIVELREQGYSPRQIAVVLLSQASVLGLVGSLAGILLGVLLAQTLFRGLPSYLTFAFPIAPHPVIQPTIVLVALACGVLAALLASLAPLWDLRPGQPVEAVLSRPGEVGQAIAVSTIRYLAFTAAGLVVASTALVLLAPGLAVLGGALLAVAAVAAVPAVCSFAVGSLRVLSERTKRSMLPLAVGELRATATRSTALAAVAVLAVYGLVAVGGARQDLTRGLDQAISQYLNTAQVWVTPRNENVYTTDSFHDKGATKAVSRAAGVASARRYYGALLDVGSRRMWIRARSPADPTVLQSSQITQGNYQLASRRIDHGGWAAISGAFAAEKHITLGAAFELPTPAGQARFRCAAITTNAGWPPGAITISAADFRRYWPDGPAAIEVSLKPGISEARGARAVRSALAGRPGLQVQTRSQREAQFQSVARQALSRLGEIAILLLIAGALAVAASLSAVIASRRARLSDLKAQGFTRLQLWRSLLLESTLLLAIGSVDGAILGFGAHALADKWLTSATGYPAPWSPGIVQMLLTLALIAAITLAAILLPGFLASGEAPYASFQES